MVLHILLTLTFFSLVETSLSSSVISDFHALISLKQRFQYSNSALTSWDSSNATSVCSWSGIKCFHGRVISLDISNMALYGYVSPDISNLDQLMELYIDGNNFTGEIKIENLSNLRFLNMSNNQFSGNLDWNYSSIPNVQVLDAYNNNLSAYLPIGVLDLKNLKHLELGGNYFHGKIPESYGNMVGLEYLSLSGNELHGKIPKELGNLTNLREIYLGYYNVYEGGIPREFGRLVNLVHMDISSCELDGSIPLELGNLKSLNTIYLHVNRLSGPIPKALGNLTNLVNLDLSVNALTGEIPYELINLKQIRLLKMFVNRLHGSIPNFIADYPQLETLGLWMNNFTGVIPSNLGHNQRLQDVDLSLNKLTGTIPKDLCASKKLKILILRLNFLFGSIPEELGKCSSLVRVRLGQNYLNGSIPSGFIYLSELNFLELQNNMLSGALSENADSSSKQTKLAQVNLSNNHLSGFLPFSISNFSSLQIFLLSGNKFSGPIPPSIGELHQAIKIDLSGNNLTGEIPHEIGNCVHLNYLDLSQNNLSGSIPEEISNIRILNYLNLSENHLSDTIPQSIGSMKSLTTADFSFNNLSGNIPQSGQFLLFNASSFSGNPQLCGSLLNNTCNFIIITTPPGNKSHNAFKIIFALGLLICSLLLATAAIIKAKSFKKTPSNSWKMTAFQKLDFTVSDVLECVKDGNVIGRGGAGIVYHGKMPNGVEIAVKKLLGFNGIKGHDHGFKAEIQTLGNIKHRNIVKLLAFCSNMDTNLLIYEYMRNGSLGETLHGKKGGFLKWHSRYKIALEAAKGLCYLHHDCSPLIVHRDVKSNNILLNSSFEAHVADFGLAKFMTDNSASQSMSAIAGSYGYIAPEYAYTLRVDEKSDVYSFGVVLLELVSGRRPVGEFGEGVDIVQWTRCSTNCRREEVSRVIDPRLTVVPRDEAMHLFFVAMLCVQENSVERPTMREVVQMLSESGRRSPEYHSSSSAIGYQLQKF
ncbi:hypothetical protein BUALT_Bualt15G0089900 [Buddleja alternifolia]|uniref:non-specific serine/threonine protein kinase n=1 Tax=Buddleja alternifolia TaxID=168488 RepID=A0AAV6WF80_9LAMI|nr:hypothetical protein BUALT_Bualt15G0089900 [Buddleja alternifolia]